jgi:hypothetical protein
MLELLKLPGQRTEKLPVEYCQNGWDRQLEAIYHELKGIIGWPTICKDASKMVQDRLGFSIIKGYFDSDFGGWGTHFWNIDPQQRIVELVGVQFNPDMLPWRRLPSGVLVINPDSNLGKRYLRYS